MHNFTNFQKDLHRLVVSAMRECVEKHSETPDLHRQITDYFKKAKEGVDIGFCFCPLNARIPEMLDCELEILNET